MVSKNEKVVGKSKQVKKSKSASPEKKKENIKIKVTKLPKRSNVPEERPDRQNMNLTVGNIDKQSSRTTKKLRKRKLS